MGKEGRLSSWAVNVCGALWALVRGCGRSIYGILASDRSWGEGGASVGDLRWHLAPQGARPRCPGCLGPFEYSPNLEPVMLDSGVYWHKACWPRRIADQSIGLDHYEGGGGICTEAPPISIPDKKVQRSSRWGSFLILLVIETFGTGWY